MVIKQAAFQRTSPWSQFLIIDKQKAPRNLLFLNMRNIIALLYSTKITDCGKRGGGTITIKITVDIVFRVEQSVGKSKLQKWKTGGAYVWFSWITLGPLCSDDI